MQSPSEPIDLNETFEHFRQRVAMYTGERSLVAIRNFLFGYQMAVDWRSCQAQNDPFYIPWSFHPWTAFRLNTWLGSRDWAWIIREAYDSEDEAVDCFFRLLAEYQRRESFVVAMLLGHPSFPQDLRIVAMPDVRGIFTYSQVDDVQPGFGSNVYTSWRDFVKQTGVRKKDLQIVDATWNPK